jgi:hypothetical protein
VEPLDNQCSDRESNRAPPIYKSRALLIFQPVLFLYMLIYLGHRTSFRIGERDSSVSVVTGYAVDGQGSIPWRGKRFLHNVQTSSGAHRVSYLMGTRAVSPGVKWQGREAHHQSTTKVKNGGAIPPLHIFHEAVLNYLSTGISLLLCRYNLYIWQY